MDFYYDESSPSCLRWASARSNMKAATGYVARVQAGGVRHQRAFPTLQQAAEWVRAKRQEVHGEFSKHG